MTVAHVFVADLGAAEPAIGDDDRHHLERVLRVRPGEEVTVSDGAGGLRRFVVARTGTAAGLVLEPAGEVEREPRRLPEVTVGFALVKGERPEWVVQKLTECGVDRIIPFVADRGVVRWEAAKAARNVDRLRRIAREAAMQSRRRWLPQVVDLVDFESAVAIVRGVGAAMADMSGGPPTLATPALLVGPEGGWSDAERSAGLPAVRLGPTILRAETAAVAAGSLLVALREGVVGPAPVVGSAGEPDPGTPG